MNKLGQEIIAGYRHRPHLYTLASFALAISAAIAGAKTWNDGHLFSTAFLVAVFIYNMWIYHWLNDEYGVIGCIADRVETLLSGKPPGSAKPPSSDDILK